MTRTLGKGSAPSLHHVVRSRIPQAEIEALLAAGANLNARDVDGPTPLHYAVIFHPEAPEAIEVLLDAGADPMAQNASELRRSSTNHLNPIDCVELPDGIKSTFSY